jgi:hypothetical protein
MKSVLPVVLVFVLSSCGDGGECIVGADCATTQQCIEGQCVESTLPPPVTPFPNGEGEGEGDGRPTGEGEGEGDVRPSGEGEGEGDVRPTGEGEGEGDGPTGEGEGEGPPAGEGEGEGPPVGEGEGEGGGEGEGEGEPLCGGTTCAFDEVCVSDRCAYNGAVCDAAFDVVALPIASTGTYTLAASAPYVSWGPAGRFADARRVMQFDVNSTVISTRFGTDLDITVTATFDSMAAAYDSQCTELGGADDVNGMNDNSSFSLTNVQRQSPVVLIVGGYNDNALGSYDVSIVPSLCGGDVTDATQYENCARAFDANTSFTCNMNNPCERDAANQRTGFGCCTVPGPGCGRATATDPIVRFASPTCAP